LKKPFSFRSFSWQTYIISGDFTPVEYKSTLIYRGKIQSGPLISNKSTDFIPAGDGIGHFQAGSIN